MGYRAIAEHALQTLPAYKAAKGIIHGAENVIKAPTKALGSLLGIGGPSKGELRERRMVRLRHAIDVGDYDTIENYAYGAHGGKGSRFGKVRRAAQWYLAGEWKPGQQIPGNELPAGTGEQEQVMPVLKGAATAAGMDAAEGPSTKKGRSSPRLRQYFRSPPRRARKKKAAVRSRRPRKRRLKFGSPAWRAKYMGKRRRRKRRR